MLSVYPTDVAFVDEQRVLADRGPAFRLMAKRTGLLGDLLWMAHHVWWPGDEVDIAGDEDVVAANREPFERLLAFAAQEKITLVVWQPLGAVELLQPYVGRPGVVFLDWRTAFGGAHCDGAVCDWQDDAALAFPDGHPLPTTNGKVADVIAGAILGLEESAHSAKR